MSNLEMAVSPLASSSISETFLSRARQGWQKPRKLQNRAAADVNKECGSVEGIRKVACVRDALTNFSDNCKAIIAAIGSDEK